MINDIISGISKVIYQTYGDAYKIYTVTVTQNLQEPCFIISAINNTNESQLGSFSSGNHRYFRRNHFSVQYLPDPKLNLLENSDKQSLQAEHAEKSSNGTISRTAEIVHSLPDFSSKFSNAALAALTNRNKVNPLEDTRKFTASLPKPKPVQAAAQTAGGVAAGRDAESGVPYICRDSAQ